MATTPTTLTPRRPPLADGVFYPETDGMPLPDGPEQEPHYREIVSILELRFAGPTTMVSGNTFIYYVEGNPRKSLAPDCYVAFDVSMESIELYNTYLAWKVGKMPDFVLEVGSPSTASNDVGPKRDLYASLGVREYWRFESHGRRPLRRAAGGRVPGGWRVPPLRDEERAGRRGSGSQPAVGPRSVLAGRPSAPLRPSGGPLVGELRRAGHPRRCRAGGTRVRRSPRRYAERTARESAEARLAEMEAELQRLRDE